VRVFVVKKFRKFARRGYKVNRTFNGVQLDSLQTIRKVLNQFYRMFVPFIRYSFACVLRYSDVSRDLTGVATKIFDRIVVSLDSDDEKNGLIVARKNSDISIIFSGLSSRGSVFSVFSRVSA